MNLSQLQQAFSDFRNADMHVRDMTEFIRLGGERAIIWLEGILSEEPDPEGEEIDNEES